MYFLPPGLVLNFYMVEYSNFLIPKILNFRVVAPNFMDGRSPQFLLSNLKGSTFVSNNFRESEIERKNDCEVLCARHQYELIINQNVDTDE